MITACHSRSRYSVSPFWESGCDAEPDPLTWTWMHSWPAQDRGDGIPPEEWSTWAGPAWETEGGRVSAGPAKHTQLTANPPALICYSSPQIRRMCNGTVAIDYESHIKTHERR